MHPAAQALARLRVRQSDTVIAALPGASGTDEHVAVPQDQMGADGVTSLLRIMGGEPATVQQAPLELRVHESLSVIACIALLRRVAMA